MRMARYDIGQGDYLKSGHDGRLNVPDLSQTRGEHSIAGAEFGRFGNCDVSERGMAKKGARYRCVKHATNLRPVPGRPGNVT